MEAIKNIGGFILLIAVMFFIAQSCEPEDPYEQGMHLDYHIECENGFIYKVKNRAAMQIFNSDGTPLRCGHKIY
jgi:hypothetical protein